MELIKIDDIKERLVTVQGERVVLDSDEARQKSLMERSGEIFGEILGDGLKTTGTETSVELNFAVMKVKHTVKRAEQ